jgi:hypothetical protein
LERRKRLPEVSPCAFACLSPPSRSQLHQTLLNQPKEEVEA